MVKLSAVHPLLLFKAALSCASIVHPDVVKTFSQGQTVDLECLITMDRMFDYWIKLTVGEAPVFIVSFYLNSKEPTFLGEFENNSRYKSRKKENRFVLTITDAEMSDVGMYYCAVRNYDEITFGRGVFLTHEGADTRSQHLVQQPVSESIQPGDSVTLNCTIHADTCPGEHSVYWFRQGSGESRPGILYTHGGRSDQCEKSPEAGSPTQSCVYNLPKRNLSLSDAGTYYCAVASCGEILFGNGTRLNIEEPSQPDPMLLALIMSNILSLIVIVLISVRLRKVSSQGKTHRRPYATASQSSHVAEEEEELNYAAVNIHKREQTGTRQTMEMDVVYSGVRQWE
ncbi:signal-regulatory protein beta-2-like [Osmerus mordax]|uniref:signal-regulatory protein beta-2-like n=1 Tax=Osmerus mordax TaxID=8014 RepID=UPI00350F4BBC